ncbi:hypothetical protein DL771_009664 [Monosporascus sp. 5C6A]|nr:hypothetical protein DL771_009664 [Monosporascus sp. 5C6A]
MIVRKTGRYLYSNPSTPRTRNPRYLARWPRASPRIWGPRPTSPESEEVATSSCAGHARVKKFLSSRGATDGRVEALSEPCALDRRLQVPLRVRVRVPGAAVAAAAEEQRERAPLLEWALSFFGDAIT